MSICSILIIGLDGKTVISFVLDVTGVLNALGLDTTTLVVRKVVASIELAVRVTTLLVDPDTVRFASP